jgi:hypothetical protein
MPTFKVSPMPPELKAKYKKHLRDLLITESMIETAFGDGEERGIEKGIEKNKTDVILRAHLAEASIPFIAKIVELTEEEVRDILKANGQI